LNGSVLTVPLGAAQAEGLQSAGKHSLRKDTEIRTES